MKHKIWKERLLNEKKDIAKMFDIYPSTINWIKKGKTWKNI